MAGPFQERSERGLVLGGEKAAKGTAHHLLQRAFDHPGEALVGVKNHLVSRQRQRPFVHGFDEHAVGVLGAFQREHLRALFARDHHRIHFAGADGAERFLRFGQAGAELGELAGLRRAEVARRRRDGARRAERCGRAVFKVRFCLSCPNPTRQTGRWCSPGCR